MLNEVSLGHSISKVTLGTAQLGMAYGIANKSGKPDETATANLLNEAIECGVNCFDTAHLYGDSERVLGHFFADKPKPLIVSKIKLSIERDILGKEMEATIRGMIEGSLKRLGLDRIPILMLHNPDVLAVHGASVTGTLDSLISEGLIGHAGVSFTADVNSQFAPLWPFVQNDLFEAVQIPMNMMDLRLFRNGGLDALHRAGKTVFVRSVFLQGLLLMSDSELPAFLLEARKPLGLLRRFAEREGMSMAQLAVSFIRDLPAVHSLVIGADTAEQVRDNVTLVASGPKLGAESREEITGQMTEVPELLLNPYLWNAFNK